MKRSAAQSRNLTSWRSMTTRETCGTSASASRSTSRVNTSSSPWTLISASSSTTRTSARVSAGVMRQSSLSRASLRIGCPVSMASTLWWSTARGRSGSPQQDHGTVVGGDRRNLVDDDARSPAEAAWHQPLGRAEQPVDADGQVPAGRLDQAVGIEQQRVVRAEHALGNAERGVRQQAQERAFELDQPPPAATSGVVRHRRMTSGRQPVVAGGEVDGHVHPRREALELLLPDQVGVRGVEELLRCDGAEKTTERSREHQCARAGVEPLAGHVDDRELEAAAAVGACGDEEVAAERRAARRSQVHVGMPPRRQRRQIALALQLVAQLEKDRLTPPRREAEALAIPRELQRHQRDEDE